MSSPQPEEGSNSFHDEDENDVASQGGGSSHSQNGGGGDRSYHSGDDRSYYSGDERSYYSGEDGSYYSNEDGSFYSERDGGSQGSRSFYSDQDGGGSHQEQMQQQQFQSDDAQNKSPGSSRSQEGSQKSYYSDEGSYRSGESQVSHRNGQGSFYSEEGGSYYSERGGGSQGSRSFHSEQDGGSQGSRSFHSEQDGGSQGSRSFHSEQDGVSQGSQSFYSEQDGGGSHQEQMQQQQEFQSGNMQKESPKSFRSQEGSQKSYYSEGSQKSCYSDEEGRNEGGGSQASYRSGQGSQGSYYSGDDRSGGEHSYHDGDDHADAEIQLPDENGSFHSNSSGGSHPRSYSSGDGSYYSEDDRSSYNSGVENISRDQEANNDQIPNLESGQDFYQGNDEIDIEYDKSNPSQQPHDPEVINDEESIPHPPDNDDFGGFADNPFPPDDDDNNNTNLCVKDDNHDNNNNNGFTDDPFTDESNSYREQSSYPPDPKSTPFEEDNFDDAFSGGVEDDEVSNSFADDDENSYPDENNSYPPDDRSYRSESQGSQGSQSYPGDRSYRSGSQGSHGSQSYPDDRSHNDCPVEDDEFGEPNMHDDIQQRTEQSPGGLPPHPGEDGLYSPREGQDDRSSVAASFADGSFAEDVSPRSEQSRKVDDLNRSAGESEFDSEAPSFAEDADFSPFPKSDEQQPDVIFEGEALKDNTIDLSAEEENEDPESTAEVAVSANAFSSDPFSADAADNGTDDMFLRGGGEGDAQLKEETGFIDNGAGFDFPAVDESAQASTAFEDTGDNVWAAEDAFGTTPQFDLPEDGEEGGFSGFDESAFEADAFEADGAFGSTEAMEKGSSNHSDSGKDPIPANGDAFGSDPFGDKSSSENLQNGEAPNDDAVFDGFGTEPFSGADPFGTDQMKNTGADDDESDASCKSGNKSQDSYPDNESKSKRSESENSKSYHSSVQSQSRHESITSALESRDPSFASEMPSPRAPPDDAGSPRSRGSSRYSNSGSYKSEDGSSNRSFHSSAGSMSQSHSRQGSARSASRSFHSPRDGSHASQQYSGHSGRSSYRSERSKTNSNGTTSQHSVSMSNRSAGSGSLSHRESSARSFGSKDGSRSSGGSREISRKDNSSDHSQSLSQRSISREGGSFEKDSFAFEGDSNSARSPSHKESSARSFRSQEGSQGYSGRSSGRSRSFRSSGGSQADPHQDHASGHSQSQSGRSISQEGDSFEKDSFAREGDSYSARSPSRKESSARSFRSQEGSQGYSGQSSGRSRSFRSSGSSQADSHKDHASGHSQSQSRRSISQEGDSFETDSFALEGDSYSARSPSHKESSARSFRSQEGSQGNSGRSSGRSRSFRSSGGSQVDSHKDHASGHSQSQSRRSISQEGDSFAREGDSYSARSSSRRSGSRSRSRSYRSDNRSFHSSQYSGSRSRSPSQYSREGSVRSRSLSQSRSGGGSRSLSPSGNSFAGDDEGPPPGSRSPSASGSISRSNRPESNAVDGFVPPGDVSEASEESIGIGDVFGQPNELFEHNSSVKEEDESRSSSRASRSQGSENENQSDTLHKDAASKETSGDLYGEQITLASKDVADGSGTMRSTVVPEAGSVSGTISTLSHSLVAAKTMSEGTKRTNDSAAKSGGEKDKTKKKKKKKKKKRKDMRSQALQDLVFNVNEAMIDLELHEEEDEDGNHDTSAHRLLQGFDALVGVYLQLSDELELITTFSKMKKKKKDEEFQPAINALKAVLSFAETLDQLFADLNPIILDCFEEEPDEDMDDMLFRLNSLVDLLCETTHRVGDKQEWNERIETTYVTLLELMEREALELRCYFEDVDTPEYGLSSNIHEAWSATGHIEELRALQYAGDPCLFRQICYEVMVSTDQWCPDTTMLMEICGIDPSMLEEEPDPDYLEEDELAPIPQAAEHVLDKVNGDPLPRTIVMASILRRILPPRAMLDPTLLDHFTSIRNTLENPLGLSATNIVSISSIPEVINDPDSLGVGGMGKTTLAAMVAEHPDVRRYFIDGVVWVYVGDKELNYSRYTQCLRELVAQLDFYQGIPLFAELLHTPGETLSKRHRREEGFMIYARDTIAELLHDRSVLIILDDVCFEPDLDWFDFAPMPGESPEEIDSNCALLVTTRCRTLLPAADTVEVDMLDEADAISLLIQESGQLSHTLMAESREARSVVRECANHPLAVKSVGRWLNLKHATAGVVSSVEEIHSEVIKSMDKILKGGDHTGADMMYEVLSMSLSPAINGEPTSIIKFCLAAFVVVFCDKEYISDFALTEPTPIIPMDMSELLFETLLEMNESSLLQEGSLFYAQKKEAAVLIPEALSALGVLKVITYSDAEDEEESQDEQKFLQVMHFIHHEYGEFLSSEEEALKELTKDAERQWNRSLVEAYLSRVEEWDASLEDAGHSYALEMIISHMIRGGMYSAAVDLLADKSFVRGRLLSLGRENTTRRHIKDCEVLFKKLKERRMKGSKLEPRNVMKQAYQALGSQLALDDEDQSIEDSRIKDVEVARAHYEIGFSLAEKRCWDAAIAHWETSQELLVSALGTVEVVAGILYNIGVVYSEMNEYEQALDSLKQCLRIRGTIHGEEHILYAQTIQKIGDIFLGMSDYHEAMESYNWALDVMYIEPSHHRVEIGEILDNKGIIHYSKGEIDEALQCHQEALRSKQVDLGEDHPELAATYHHIGNCLSDQGNVDDAIVHFEEAIRLKELDYGGGPERDADVLTIEGILHNLEGNQEQGLECYEKSLQILVTKVPHRKEKVASLLHLIGCVYLMSGEQKKAMKLFEESLQARRKVLGFVHLDVASTLFNMAFLHQTRNRLDKALKCLEEALKIRQLRLPDSEKVAVTHEKIGSLARAIGKTKKAQIGFEEALRIRRLIHGEQHEAVATVLQELGDLMDDLGEYDSAMSYYIDALDIRRNRLGLDDIAVAETLYSMGYTLHNNDESDRALVCFEESLSIRRYQLGEDSKEVGDTLNMMGFLKAKRGGLDDALTFLWDALRIRKLQEDHVKVSETLKNIGNVHREKQEYDLAVECYAECLKIRRTELGADHEKVADALIAMGNVQSDMERNDEAMRSYQEALKIRTLVFGEHDESVAAVLQYMGTMEFRANNHEKARDLLSEFIRIRRENNTKNDGDYVNVLFMIGNIHKMQGQEDEAQLCWTEAYQVFQELGLAEGNPQIAKVMNHLLKVDLGEENNGDQKKKAKRSGMFGKFSGGKSSKLKEAPRENKPSKRKKRRNGKGIQL